MDCEFEHGVKVGTATGEVRLVDLGPPSPSQALLMIVLEKKSHGSMSSRSGNMFKLVP